MLNIGLATECSGLGDLIMLTAILKQCPSLNLVLPEKSKNFVPLFAGYNVSIDSGQLYSNRPLNMIDGSGQHYNQKKLISLNLNPTDFLPKINLDKIPKTSSYHDCKIQTNCKNVMLITNCSRHWAHVRELPIEFWENLVKHNKNTIFHHFRQQYSFKIQQPNVIEYIDYELCDYAHMISKLDGYVGLDTGDYHLAIAASIIPKNAEIYLPKTYLKTGYNPNLWLYPETKLTFV